MIDIDDHNRSKMIIFGGSTVIIDNQHYHQQSISQRTNDLWQWHNNNWSKIEVISVRPEPRNGHSQFTLNSNNILIVGGSSPTSICRDVWLFSFSSHQWTQISIQNQYPHDFAPSGDSLTHLPFCFVPLSNVLITFGRLKRHPTENERFAYSQYDFSHCDNRTSSLVLPPPSSSSDESDETARFRNRTTTHKRSIQSSFVQNKYHMMDISNGLQMYRLDLSNLFSIQPSVTWLPSRATSVFGSPSCSSLYYSLVYTRTEFILFGGIEKRKLNRQTLMRSEKEDHPFGRSSSPSGTLAFITVSNISL